MRTVIYLLSLMLCPWYVATATADLYQWTDVNGVLHIVDEAIEVPDEYREELTVYSAPEAEDPAGASRSAGFANPDALPLVPSRIYAIHSQGAFAQKLALDLGLIKSEKEDALGPLSGAGIGPAGSWRVSDPLSHEAFDEISAAVRRAAQSQRLKLSAAEAVAAVDKVAQPYLPVPEVVQAAPEPEIVVIQQPPQIIEVIHEPHYEVIHEPYYVPVPYGYGSGRFPHHRRMRDQIQEGFPGGGGGVLAPPSEPRQTPGKPPLPSLSRSPVGVSRLPMGTSRLPFGSSSAASPTLRR
jgi:hypothetical protein